MRFAPPAAMRLLDRGGGLNQTSVRAYNERLVLSLLRQHEWLSRVDICQKSGLSAQAVSGITAALEQEGLIRSGALLRGRVGPPSRLLALDADGAYSLGVKIGTRSTDLVLIDFVGVVRHRITHRYPSPERAKVFAAIDRGLSDLVETLDAAHRSRIVGIGVALPHDIEDWPLADWAAARGESWRNLDLEARLGTALSVPVYLQNDVTAAAGAELIFGRARDLSDFAYFFIGSRTTGRLVLNHHVYAGRQAGPRIPGLGDFETLLRTAGADADAIWRDEEDWTGVPEEVFDAWAAACADGIVQAIGGFSGFVDLATLLVDGRFPAARRDQLCRTVRDRLARPDGSGSLEVLSGEIGWLSKAVGAACMPFHARYMIDGVGLVADVK